MPINACRPRLAPASWSVPVGQGKGRRPIDHHSGRGNPSQGGPGRGRSAPGGPAGPRSTQADPSAGEPVHPQNGILVATEAASWLRLWREPQHLMLAVPWPLFFVLLCLAYLAINGLFTGLYLLDPGGIGGTTSGRAGVGEAFFFSVQTLGSIGYGVLYPASGLVNLLVTAESLTGLIFVAISTGLVFARFSSSRARIRFSERAVVHAYNGVPTLAFRLANERRNTILAARLKVFLAIDECSSEGHSLRRLLPLPLMREEGIALLLTWTAMHPIDAHSPLQGLDRDTLDAAHAEIVVAFSGIDATLERPIHARTSYQASQLATGYCFVDMLDTSQQQRRINLSRFNQIRPCP